MSQFPWSIMMLVGLHATAGAVLGFVTTRTLRSATDHLASRGGLLRIIGMMFARLALVGGIMALAAREGAVPLLALAFGLLAARWLLMRHSAEATA